MPSHTWDCGAYAMIEIKTYSGFKGEERPKAVIIDGIEHRVENIVRKEVLEDCASRERRTVFWCEVNRAFFKITHRASGEWEVAFLPPEVNK